MTLDELLDSANTVFKWLYWIVGTIVVFVISYVLYTRFNKQVASILVFIASMMALYYYYVKWFIVGPPLPVPFNICPEFLESIGTVNDGKQFVCVDKQGNYPNFGRVAYDNPQTFITNTVTPAFNGLADAKPRGKVNPSSTATGYVITPLAEGTEAYCSNLSNAGLSHFSLCNTYE